MMDTSHYSCYWYILPISNFLALGEVHSETSLLRSFLFLKQKTNKRAKINKAPKNSVPAFLFCICSGGFISQDQLLE